MSCYIVISTEPGVTGRTEHLHLVCISKAFKSNNSSNEAKDAFTSQGIPY